MTSHPNRSKKSSVPRSILKHVSLLYPSAWNAIDALRVANNKNNAWPKCIFCPSLAIRSLFNGNNDLRIIAGLAAWRLTQSIYVFSPEIIKKLELQNETLATPIPKMPEWCMYICTPELLWNEEKLNGYFCYLDLGENGEILSTLILVVGDISANNLVEISITMTQLLELDAFPGPNGLPVTGATLDTVKLLLNMYLYLCRIDITFSCGGTPSKPKPKRTKNGWVFFEPSKPKIWEVID